MENIVLFDPSIRSLNKGDEIIMRSAEKYLSPVLIGNYVIKSATHSPILTFYQNTRLNPRMRFYDDAKYKFLCGSNMIWKNMLKVRPTFNANLFNCMPYRNSIMMGCGIAQTQVKRTNIYTKSLYSKIFSKEYYHSVRDEKAAEFIKSLGYKVINTGCPTMWGFSEEFCKEIPAEKADKVIFTLTDYNKNSEFDGQLIDILLDNYKEVYFWIQGAFDFEYLQTLPHTEKIQIVNPTVDDYSDILACGNIDYVGTRLHAGLFAMQHKIRTIIIAIDNRAISINESYNLNIIDRNKTASDLANKINSDFRTNVKINHKNIELWLNQFM